MCMFATYFDEGRGAVREQQRAQLSALPFVLIFADPLAETEDRFSADEGRCRRRGERKRTARASVYNVSASCNLPNLNAWFPSSFSRSTSFTRFRRRCAGSWPGSYRSAD